MVDFSSLAPHLARVAELLVAGRSNKAIAHSLGLQTHTIEVYASQIFRLLNVTSRSDLISRYWRGEL